MNITAQQAKDLRANDPALASFPAPVRRLISMVDNLRDPAYIPDYDVEIVDADAIYVNFAYSRALVISEVNTQRGHTWEVLDVSWDRTGGVDREGFVAEVTGYELGTIVKAYLARMRAEEDKLEAELTEASEHMD